MTPPAAQVSGEFGQRLWLWRPVSREAALLL